MTFLLALLLLAMNAAWLWFCMVYFTGDHSIGWRGLVFWVFIAMLFRAPFGFFVEDLEPKSLYYLFSFLGYAPTYIFLYVIIHLRYRVTNTGLKLKILTMHFIGMRILGLFIKGRLL